MTQKLMSVIKQMDENRWMQTTEKRTADEKIISDAKTQESESERQTKDDSTECASRSDTKVRDIPNLGIEISSDTDSSEANTNTAESEDVSVPDAAKRETTEKGIESESDSDDYSLTFDSPAQESIDAYSPVLKQTVDLHRSDAHHQIR